MHVDLCTAPYRCLPSARFPTTPAGTYRWNSSFQSRVYFVAATARLVGAAPACPIGFFDVDLLAPPPIVDEGAR